MFNPTYLCLSRHNIYYFRFPLRGALLTKGRVRDIKLSLQTRCPKEALYLGRALVYFADIAIKNPIIRVMDFHEIRAILKDHFSTIRDNLKKRIAKEGQLDASFVKMCVDNQGWAKQSLEYQDYSIVGSDTDIEKLVHKYNLSLKPDSKEFELFRIEYIKAYRDFHKSALDYNSRYDNFNFSTSSQSTAKTKTKLLRAKIKLADVIDKYIDDGVLKRNWSDKTARSYRAELNLMLNYMGLDCPLNLSKQDVVSITDMLSKVPKNRDKKDIKGLSIKELMLTDVEDYPRMDLKTVKKYISRYGSFYTWAMRHYDDVEHNYFLDFQKDIRINDGAVRDPFSSEQVKKILEVLLSNESNIVKKDHHKWGALIGLYTGARRNEIAQLELDDIKEIDNILCFDINEISEHDTKKKLKTPTSERVIPIHPDLIEYGFIDYLELIRGQGHVRVFPKLNYDVGDGGYGRAIGRWFNDTLLSHLGFKKENVVFHCLRHTLSDRLRNANVPEPVVNAITGHANVGMGHKKYFKQGYNPQLLKDAILKLDYHL